jgi:multidrug efflux pump subunit AcrA (membrane-fusion protein)
LLPGDSVLVTVEYGPPIDVVLIPQTAVRRSPAGTSVFLAVEVAGDGVSETSLRAKSVPVTLAGSQGAMSRILDGVSPDDRVVADGSFKVLEGSLLAPTDAASPPRSGADPMQITDSEEHPVAAPKPENRQ